MDPLTNSLLAGMFYTLAGVLSLARHMLLAPDMCRFPRAPSWLLNILFTYAVVLVFIGTRYLWVWGTGQAVSIPPGAPGIIVLAGGAALMCEGALLCNVARQRLPATVWARLNKITEGARCPEKRGYKG